MLRKYATATIISAEIASRNALGLVKSSHRAVFNYEPREGFLYVRSRMISSRCNDNHDEFPAEEIKKAWKTAIGKPVFVNHRNEDHRRMRGVIIDAALHEDTLPDGKPDIWIEALHEIDAVRFPKLAQAILSGRVNRTSMGCDVGHSVCSACGNKASTPAEYCDHIPRSKGKILYRHTASGEREGHLIREKCYKLSFFENSFLVEDPADPTAVVTGIDDRGLKTTASVRKQAIPEGMRFSYVPPENHPSGHPGHHLLRALSPSGEEIGSLKWSGSTEGYGAGMVDMVKTHPDYERQGIASALWRRAHGLANERGIAPPAHSDVQYPAGRGWAEKVDREPMVVPGEPTDYEIDERRPRYDAIDEHLQHEHNVDPSWANGDEGRLGNWHDQLHRSVMGEEHRHASRQASLRKLAEHYVECDQGHEHWGPYGAAGLLIRHQGDDGETRYLLQKRSPWVDHGNTWGIPGGALEHDESPEEGAQRETEEEMGELPEDLHHHKTHTDDHGGWAYHTVVMDSPERFTPHGGDDDESRGHGWFTTAEMKNMKLHPGFKNSLRTVTAGLFKKPKRVDWAENLNRPVADTNQPLHVLDHLKSGHGWNQDAFNSMSPNENWQQAHDRLHREGVPGMTDDDGMHFHGMRKGAPFAGYDDFEDCTERNADKDDPDAYCGEVKHRVEGLKTLAELNDEDIHKGLGLPTSEQGHKDIVHEKAKAIADSLLAPLYEPHGGYEGYMIHQGNEGMMDLKRRYEGGSGKFGFDEGEDPYYEVHHTNPQGRHTGWSIRHYSDGPNAEVRHDATPDETHELFDIGEDTYHSEKGGLGRHVKPPSQFGHKDLEGVLKHWVEGPEEETGGAREYLESQHGDPRIRRWKQRYPQGKLPPRNSSLPSALAYGETKAPADVDTLRTESCPVCGETDSFDGDRCMVCNFIQPPSMFKDPDTSVARQMDLKQEPFNQGMVGPDGQPVQMDPSSDPEDVNPAGDMEGIPGQPEDQIADLFCPACGFSADTKPPTTTNDPAMPSEQQGLVEGDVCPNCGEATMLSANDVGAMGGEVPQEIAADADADAIPDDEEADANGDGIPDDADLDGDGVPDLDEQDVEGEGGGVPEGDGSEAPGGDGDEGEEPEVDDSDNGGPVEDEDEAQKGRKDKSRRASRRGHGKEDMNKPKTAATGASSKIAALERQIAAQNEVIKIAGQQLHYLATLAGIVPEFEAIKTEGMKKIADIMNPAQPVPDPAGTSPSETTEQAEAPETYDDPRRPGITPGSTQGVPAMATDTPLAPGATVPTSPVNQLVDVTAPVEGTQSHVPYDQTKIETDVRVGDPMVNADNPQGYGFPLTDGFAQDGAASANTTTSPGMQQNRTMASIRLARLRKSAGLIGASVDELAEAAKIERDASLSTELIAHEIRTLDTVSKAASKASPGRRPQGGALPKQASNARRAPSLVGAPDLNAGIEATAGLIDGDAADLFM